MDKLIDSFGREIDYLRVSITDRCNMRCIYCMPSEGILHKPHGQILSFEEIYRIVNAAVRLGISKVRITGGEPLVRKDLDLFIKNLRRIKGLNEIALTTNGVYLKEHAFSLKEAGLDRVNISLDSLVPEKFREITRGGSLTRVLEGMEAALSAGLWPVKINVVLLRGFNDSEIISFAELSRSRPAHVRFIEYMPTNLIENYYGDIFFSCQEAMMALGSIGKLEPVENNYQLGTARVFKIKGFCGTLGFISPVSSSFCPSCNKLRLTSDGHLRSCLHSAMAIDLKSEIEKGVSDEDLAMLIKKAVSLKPESHNLNLRNLRDVSKRDTQLSGVSLFDTSPKRTENFSMCQIGG